MFAQVLSLALATVVSAAPVRSSAKPALAGGARAMLLGIYQLKVLSPLRQQRLGEVLALTGQTSASPGQTAPEWSALLDRPERLGEVITDIERTLEPLRANSPTEPQARALSRRLERDVERLVDGTRFLVEAVAAADAVFARADGHGRRAAGLRPAQNIPMRPGALRAIEKLAKENRFKGAAQSSRLADALAALDFNNAIFFDPNAPWYALEAYRAGKISLGQFAGVALLAEAMDDAKAQEAFAVRLFRGGLLSAAAKSALDVRATNDDDGRWIRLLGLLKKLPASEQVFWLVPISPSSPLADGKFAQGLASIRSGLRGYRTDFPLDRAFNGEPAVPRGHYLIVPSFAMMQAWIDSAWPGQGVRLQPDLGIQTEDELIESHSMDARPISLSMPGRGGKPVQADEYWMTKFVYSMHDLFHAFWGSRYPRDLRSVFFDAYARAKIDIDKESARPVAGAPAWRLAIRKRALAQARKELADYVVVEDKQPELNAWAVLRFKVLTPYILDDMQKNPARYRALGVDPNKLDAEVRSRWSGPL